MSDSIIIIPTYNERENVQKMMDAILNLSTPFDLLFIDDASPDKTSLFTELALGTCSFDEIVAEASFDKEDAIAINFSLAKLR